MQNLVFAFGPDDSYVFNTPKQWSCIREGSRIYGRNLPPKLGGLVGNISDILCAAFGPGKDQYFMSYYDKSKAQQICYGGGVSPKLIEWLVDSKTQALKRGPQLRVALGPNNSFFAWDADSMRWSNIPEAFEEDLQEWLSPTGWNKGPPRIVALGSGGSYFAHSEYGSVALSPRLTGLTEKIIGWVKEEGYDNNTIAHVSLHPTDPDQYLIIKNTGSYSSCITTRTEQFYTVIDSLSDDATIKSRKAARDKAAKAKQDQANSEEQKANARQHEKEERERKRAQGAAAAEARAKAVRESALLAQLPALYLTWKQEYENKNLLTTFPSPPRKACFCTEISCLLHKNKEGALVACRHDVERLLRASGMYSLKWLKTESLAWHPDRFGLRCDPDYRKGLCAKTTELYVIFGQLIEAERENGSTSGTPTKDESHTAPPETTPTPDPKPAPKSRPGPANGTTSGEQPNSGLSGMTIRRFNDGNVDNLSYEMFDTILDIVSSTEIISLFWAE